MNARFPALDRVSTRVFHTERYERDSLIRDAIEAGHTRKGIARAIGYDPAVIRDALNAIAVGADAYVSHKKERADSKRLRACAILRGIIASIPIDDAPPMPAPAADREPAHPRWRGLDAAAERSLAALRDFPGILPRTTERELYGHNNRGN